MDRCSANFANISVKIDSIYTVYHQIHNVDGWITRQGCRPAEGLAYVVDGSAIYHFRDIKVLVTRNDVLYLRKGDSYMSMSPPSEKRQYTIILVNFNYDDARTAVALPLTARMSLLADNRVANMFYELLDIWTNNSPFSRIRASSLLYDIIYHLSISSIRTEIHASNMQKICDSVKYIENNYQEQISLTDIASISHLSISHFVRVFNQAFKLSPIEYLIGVRLKHAKALLRDQSCSISEVAERTGFSSINYFSRVFKDREGICPSKYQAVAGSDQIETV